MAKLRIDKDGNLVTGLKRVWITQDDGTWSGCYDLWIDRPRYMRSEWVDKDGHAGLYYTGREFRCGEELFQWLESNIIGGGLPKPGEIWEVELV